jgi:hypothetical protein
MEMADVLRNPGIGGFDVTEIVDGSARDIQIAIVDFLQARGRNETVVLYLSCHGLLDDWDHLYFAAADTYNNHLTSTGIGADWLWDRLNETRATSQVIVLDCCNSGAFARSGGKGPDDAELDLKRFLPQGQGQAVLMASRAKQRSWVSDPSGAAATPSVFTSALVEGLRSGAADSDGDGWISVDEAYDYAYKKVRASGVGQNPQKSMSRAEGTLVLARVPAAAGTANLSSPIFGISPRLGAGRELYQPSRSADDVAERQRRIQADLEEAQKAYSEMGQDRYKWIEAQQKEWERIRPEVMRNLGIEGDRAKRFDEANEKIKKYLQGS